jgi:Fic family protein
MLTLRPDTFAKAAIPLSTTWLLAECMEFRGKQDLWIRQKPQVLEALRQQAVVQSVESSNRIEGVEVAPARLRPIVLGKARPQDRPEEEIAGYRKALDWIFSRKRPVPIEPRTILHLHALAQGGSIGDAGQWKRRDNEITAAGERKVRFRPTPARDTPRAMQDLCTAYRDLVEAGQAPGLLLVATAVFDFLCIHPFRDGNGRVSRLLTTLLMQQHGFIVGRFVSLERLVEESREDYYRVLGQCSQGWSAGRNEILPWWNYFLGIVRRAYAEFSQEVEASAGRPAKTDLARRAAEAQVGPFTLADLRAAAPGVSPQLLKKVLQDLQREGKVRLVGRGRGARWQLVV